MFVISFTWSEEYRVKWKLIKNSVLNKMVKSGEIEKTINYTSLEGSWLETYIWKSPIYRLYLKLQDWIT